VLTPGEFEQHLQEINGITPRDAAEVENLVAVVGRIDAQSNS